jgi:hypothetical protein
MQWWNIRFLSQTISDYEEILSDHRRLVRELDIALNRDGTSKQASLCDIVAQVKHDGLNRRPSLPMSAEVEKARPRIICLCGSTRFIELFATLAWTLERDLGVIVLGLHLLPDSYDGYDLAPDHMAEAAGKKEHFDELHKRKIDLADEIFVLNVGGYIGDSTRSEIAYAEAHGKPVKYLEDVAALKEKV